MVTGMSNQPWTEWTGPAAKWRHDFHRHPEVGYDVERTAAKVAGLLREFGVDEVVTGLGRTGVVGVIRGRGIGDDVRTIGLRAEMDALPMQETSGVAHQSTVPGKMHGCGHDGHSAMLLGAVAHLAQTREFSGFVVAIFQPAEEVGAGAKAMLNDGLRERFALDEVYSLHNLPGLPLGTFATRAGPLLAATADFEVEIRGTGAHAAYPHLSVDAVAVATTIVQALQQIVSRCVNPLDSAVLSVTRIEAGSTFNIIPSTARFAGTVRTLKPRVHDIVEKRFRELTQQVAAGFGASAEIDYRRNYPVTVNHQAQTDFARSVAAEIVGGANVREMPPIMGGEDFSFMLEACAGNFMYVGNGKGPVLHHPDYDFNDDLLPIGIGYWVTLVARALPSVDVPARSSSNIISRNKGTMS